MNSNNPENNRDERYDSDAVPEDGGLMDGSLENDQVRFDDSFFNDAAGETVDVTGENQSMGGLSDLGIGEPEPIPVSEKKGLFKRKKEESVSKPEKSSKKRLFKKKAVPENDAVVDSGFALGSSPDTQNTSDPFSKSFVISDTDENDVKILSDKERKKRSKKKNALTLGQKYGGQRKVFAVLGAILVFSLLFGVMNFMLTRNKADTASVQTLVEEEVENSTASSFPVGQAGMWMESFVRIYGTWDYKTPAGRASDLSPYLAPGMDSQAGWDGSGTQSVIYSAVSSSPKIVDKNRAIFDVTYQIQDGTWRCAQVPVYAFKPKSKADGPVDQWGFAATSNPVPMPCALRVSVPDFAPNKFNNTDSEAENTLAAEFFPGFFAAWIASDADALKQYMGPNVKTFGLGGAYEGTPEITSVSLPIGEEEEKAKTSTVYSAYVTVTVTDAGGAAMTTTYKIPVALSGGSQWQVMGEPEPVIQGLDVGGGGELPPSEGANPKEEEANDEANEYSEPQEPANEEPAESKPSAPAPETSNVPSPTPTAKPKSSEKPSSASKKPSASKKSGEG